MEYDDLSLGYCWSNIFAFNQSGQLIQMKSNTTLHPIDLMTGTPLFKNLLESDLQRLLTAGQPQNRRQGEHYFLQGDPAERIYLAVCGRIKLLNLNQEGQQTLLRIIEPGTLFGSIALAPVENYPVSAQAAEDSAAIFWPKKLMMQLVLEMPQLALNAVQMMAAHVQEFQERFVQMATERVERRLARALLRLAAQTGRKTDEGILIDLPLSRQDLAEMTGTTLFTVSRTLRRWEEAGLVKCGRERVVVCYPHGLVGIAEDLPDR